MTILFANQKGGVGKSTLAVLFSNYLSLIHKREVVFFDMDNQQSVYTKYKKATILENTPLYEVEAAELSQYPSIKEICSQAPNLITVLDVAGNIEDNGLIPIFKGADLIISPFSYDEFSVFATLDFAAVVKAYNENAEIVFIPNRVKSNVKYETLESVTNALKTYGAVTQSISERIDFQRINTYEIPDNITDVITPVFELIYNQFLRNIADE